MIWSISGCSSTQGQAWLKTAEQTLWQLESKYRNPGAVRFDQQLTFVVGPDLSVVGSDSAAEGAGEVAPLQPQLHPLQLVPQGAHPPGIVTQHAQDLPAGNTKACIQTTLTATLTHHRNINGDIDSNVDINVDSVICCCSQHQLCSCCPP